MFRKYLLFAGLILLGISFAFGAWRWSRERSLQEVPSLQEEGPSWNPLERGVTFEHASPMTRISVAPFLDQSLFERGWSMYGKGIDRRTSVTCQRYRAGVVNHHILALDLLVEFFEEAKRCHPDVKRIIILSPDHYLVGSSMLTTQLDGYNVYGEEMLVDRTTIDALLRSIPSARIQRELFEQEHGIGAVVPFIKYAWPKAMIVPFVVRSDIDQMTAEKVIAWLQEQQRQQGTFILVSSDMSHYLPQQVAVKNDQQTRRAFRENDQSFFWKAKDGYTDHGKGISLVLRALDQTTWYELDYGISTEYQGSPGFTTSYITGFWK